MNKDNEKDVFNTLYKAKLQKKVTFKFNMGDTVQISKLCWVFRKGHKQTYTDEFFIIKERVGGELAVYPFETLPLYYSLSCLGGGLRS